MSKQSSLLPQAAQSPLSQLRYPLAFAGLLFCIWGALTSGRAGLSRLFSEYGSAADSLAATERAIRFNDADPEAHFAHAVQLADTGRHDEAVVEFERATLRRPDDYFLWQELGRAREESGDMDAAVVALRQAIQLAPAYSQPRWQLGNLLLRRNDLDEAFREMRRAVAYDAELFPAMTDLAWAVCEGDANFVLEVAQPQTDPERASLARFFVNHHQVELALDLMRASGENIAEEDRRALVKGLIAAEDFHGAYRVWSKDVGISDGANGGMSNGGFEGPINSRRESSEEAFGWQPTQAMQTVQILADPNEPQSGKRSLRIDYAGNFAAAVPVISELVLVAPRSHYRLSFAARTGNLVSGALPLVAVREAAGERRVIAQSVSLPSGTNGWRQFEIDFETADATRAVTINIQRQACSSNPCPIFGRAWFDSFSLSPH